MKRLLFASFCNFCSHESNAVIIVSRRTIYNKNRSGAGSFSLMHCLKVNGGKDEFVYNQKT